MQKRTKLIMAGMGILGVTAFAFNLQPILAYQGDPGKQGPNYTPERHDQMEKAFENNDYASWKNLMNGRGRVTEVVNENNFAQFAKAHRLAEQGKYEDAQKIKQDLGLGKGGSNNGQKGKGAEGKRGNRGADCPYNNQNK